VRQNDARRLIGSKKVHKSPDARGALPGYAGTIRGSTRLQAPGEGLRRRSLVAGLASVAGIVLLGACARPVAPAPVPRIGFVNPRPLDARTHVQIDTLVASLQAYGYVEGQNIQFVWRFSASETGDDVPNILAELLALPVDLVITVGTPPTQMAKQATSTVPILGVNVGDPVGTGLVESLARPGGNTTAVSSFNAALSAKRVELLRQLTPNVRRVGYLYNLANAANVANFNELRAAGAPLGVQVQPIGLHSLDELETSVEAAIVDGVEALVIANTGAIPPGQTYARAAGVAVRHHLPSVGFERAYAEAGGLISYGADNLALYRRAGYYVDRILKGTRPAELPVEQPTLFEVVVNNGTDRALGATIPPEVQVQVTEWVS
jgi:putative ABC transport system substrate-binding protein